jgi:hypothetical protein
MILITRFIQRWRLRPVIKRLPFVLKERYGAGKFYTAGQVRTTADVLKLNPALLIPALAIACTASEFLKANLRWTEQDYWETRADIARLLGIDEQELNCEFLTHKLREPMDASNASGGIYPPAG